MKHLVLLSGGLDSTVALALTVASCTKKDEVQTVSFNYGSSHNDVEIKHAVDIAQFYGVTHQIIELAFIRKYFRSELLTGDIPEGHYEDKTMAKTVVPFRNGIMLAVAAGLAESNDIDEIVLANHAGDHAVYADCRPDFTRAMTQAVNYGTEGKVNFYAPFTGLSKAQICRLGHCLKVPLPLTWSCYKGGSLHCGTCGTCVERREAFSLAGVKDLTKYESK